MGQTPFRPRHRLECIPGSCTLHGRDLKCSICTSLSMADLIDRSTLGKVMMSGCQVRDETGDYIGGTTLPQNVAVAEAHGVKVEEHVGPNVVSPWYVAYQLQAGRGVVAQGNISALLHTSHRSNGVGVNHAVFINEVRLGSLGNPTEALVFDPMANGRQHAWGKAPMGPEWWPWSLVEAFAAALRPWGDADPRVLGPGKLYCAIGPDTEPHVLLRFGGVRSSPFPDRTRAVASGVLVHSSPHTKSSHNVVDTLARGQLFTGYQYAAGDAYQGSTKWVGNDDGTRWVHSKRLNHVGGGT